MQFQTPVDIQAAPFCILPTDRLLFVGSCFASEIGHRFAVNQFRAVVNPFGTMYNPASILHTLQRYIPANEPPDVVVLTLGTNHVYIFKETGEIVDNCQKQPAALFREEELTVQQCEDYLQQSIDLLRQKNPHVRIIITISPIRYAKYGFHGSQLSKATLLLAVHQLLTNSQKCKNKATSINPSSFILHPSSFILHPSSFILHQVYFPAYEILNDELRDYRFYKADMLHPSEQAVDYIYERFAATFFAPETHQFVAEWQPISQALAHKPLHPDSQEYREFIEQTNNRLQAFRKKYGLFHE